MYAYQLQGQQLTLWVYDPNTPGGDDVTISLDISRTDQNLIPVTTSISVHGSHPTINCFFTQSYEQRIPPITVTTHSESSLGAWPAIGPARPVLGRTGRSDRLDVLQRRTRSRAGVTTSRSRSRLRGPRCRVAGVTSVGRTPNHLDVFWVGPDGAIASTWWDAAPRLQSWGDHQRVRDHPAGCGR